MQYNITFCNNNKLQFFCALLGLLKGQENYEMIGDIGIVELDENVVTKRRVKVTRSPVYDYFIL